MSDNDIDVLVTLQDQATPGLNNLTSTFTANKMAIRELAFGATYLGSSFLSMGVALKNSNQAALQSTGNLFAMIGGITSAVGASVHFISAVGKMVDSLRKLQIASIITSALTGPAGWAKLGIGVALGGAAIYGTTKMMASTTTKTPQAGTVVNNYNIGGSLVTERQVTDTVHKGLITKGERSYTTRIK